MRLFFLIDGPKKINVEENSKGIIVLAELIAVIYGWVTFVCFSQIPTQGV